MESASLVNPPGQHRTRVHGHSPSVGACSAARSGRTSRTSSNSRKEHTRPVVVIQHKRKPVEESVSNGYAGLPHYIQRMPRSGGSYSSSRKGPLNGRNNGSCCENLIFYPSNHRRSRPPNPAFVPPSPKVTAGHRAAQTKRVLETKPNGCFAREQHSSGLEQVVPQSTRVPGSVHHPMRTERSSMSVDSGRGDEVCSSDGSVGSLTDTVALDAVTTENTVQPDKGSAADIALCPGHSSSLLGSPSADKDQSYESHADDEFLDALSNLSDGEEQKELPVPLMEDNDSSVSSSAFATPGTCSGTASPPAMPPSNGGSNSLLVSVLEEKLMGLVCGHPPGINGLTNGSSRDEQEAERLLQLKSFLVRAGSDSGVEEPQFNEDDSHEEEPCAGTLVTLSDDVPVTTCNGTCSEREGELCANDESSLSKSSLSDKETDSCLSTDINSGTKSMASSRPGLSELLQQPLQLVSETSSPGDSFYSTSLSSPTPSSPSPPPPSSPSHSDAKLGDRQPVCVLESNDSPSLSLATNDDTSTKLKKKVGKPIVAPPPLLLHCNSAPDFTCLPSPISPVPTAAPVQHSLSRHPLHNTWVMWYFTSTKPHFANYASELQHLSSVCHVEEFWSVFNNILHPSELANNSDYHFFKKGIQPLWEDPANKHGGRWVLTVKNNAQRLDNIWMEILMALIGEHITKSHYISGVVMSRRKKGDRVALWTTDKKLNINLHICKQFLRVLALGCNISAADYPRFVQDLAEERQGMSLVYTHHQDSLRSGSSYQSPSHVSLRNNLQYLLDSSSH